MSKTLVAYFSATGTTAKVASTLAKAIGGDLFEIQPEKLYTSADLNWMNPLSRSSKERIKGASRPEVLSSVASMEEYDTVFVGLPIWWYVAPKIVNTFLESYDFTGKKVIPFATSGGSGMGKTNEELKDSCKGAKLLEGRRFFASAKEAELKSWAEKMMK